MKTTIALVATLGTVPLIGCDEIIQQQTQQVQPTAPKVDPLPVKAETQIQALCDPYEQGDWHVCQIK